MADDKNYNDGNREYRSDLFSMLLNEKEYALDVYNAVNNSEYDNPDDIEIITLEHGVSLSIRNDASFVLDMSANYYEHQSTYNPNMPLRNLIYFVEDIRRKVEKEDRNLFGKAKIKIPTPHFVVFYNGEEKRPEVEIQKLSTSFCKETDEPELEVICKVYNITPGNNRELLKKTEVLRSYAYIVENVKDKIKTMSLKDAIHTTIDECISKGILSDFLSKNRRKVEKVMNLDFTFERQIELTRKEERELGRTEGREEGRIESVLSLLRKGKITLSEAAEEIGTDEDKVKELLGN
ncbi:MAG: hypothetical protein J6X97_10210 [Lachnospiraceae bacterium]|nr:hypothetical protein [Lachnospiraceae bacterium]MBP5495460.1 hypothetical protein [Lachnospiraceae bacterium]MBR6383290.1 hypothetical protein [Lachnospiraceae bacterium]